MLLCVRERRIPESLHMPLQSWLSPGQLPLPEGGRLGDVGRGAFRLSQRLEATAGIEQAGAWDAKRSIVCGTALPNEPSRRNASSTPSEKHCDSLGCLVLLDGDTVRTECWKGGRERKDSCWWPRKPALTWKSNRPCNVRGPSMVALWECPLLTCVGKYNRLQRGYLIDLPLCE